MDLREWIGWILVTLTLLPLLFLSHWKLFFESTGAPAAWRRAGQGASALWPSEKTEKLLQNDKVNCVTPIPAKAGERLGPAAQNMSQSIKRAVSAARLKVSTLLMSFIAPRA